MAFGRNASFSIQLSDGAGEENVSRWVSVSLDFPDVTTATANPDFCPNRRCPSGRRPCLRTSPICHKTRAPSCSRRQSPSATPDKISGSTAAFYDPYFFCG